MARALAAVPPIAMRHNTFARMAVWQGCLLPPRLRCRPEVLFELLTGVTAPIVSDAEFLLPTVQDLLVHIVCDAFLIPSIHCLQREKLGRGVDRTENLRRRLLLLRFLLLSSTFTPMAASGESGMPLCKVARSNLALLEGVAHPRQL